jgi:hypothetical protein
MSNSDVGGCACVELPDASPDTSLTDLMAVAAFVGEEQVHATYAVYRRLDCEQLWRDGFADNQAVRKVAEL